MKDIIKDLTLEEKIGQMIIIGMDGTAITERIKLMIQKYKIGGIILYRKNFKTYSDLLNLVKSLKELNKQNKLPLFIAIDQEGGRVNRMPKEIKNLPSASKLGLLENKSIVEETANITGEMLRNSGFNMNFAPVMDIKRFEDNHPIGDRCFGANVEIVSKYGITTMKKMQENKVISVIKHFPGHGTTKTDSHAMIPVIKSIRNIENEDMQTFKEAILDGADAMLIGHFLIRDYTGVFPTSLSKKFISQIVRKKCRFRGLIITDDLKMRAIKSIYGPKLAVKKAFEAGNDIVVFRFNKGEEEKVILNIIKLVKNKKIKESRIDRSVNRIIKIKNKYEITDEGKLEGIDIEKTNEKIEKIRKMVSK